MKRRYLRRMWEDQKTHIARANKNLFLSKAMDGVCFRADMMENTLDYVYELCVGMEDLFQLGLNHKELTNHKLLLQKLLMLGRDLMDTAKVGSDEFFLGIFLEMKLIDSWRVKGFFKMISTMINFIKAKTVVFSSSLKHRMEERFRKYHAPLHRLYFTEVA